MKKTKYFTRSCNYSTVIKICKDIIIDRNTFLKKNEGLITKVDSEDLRVDSVGNNQAVCILRLTYFEK